MGSCLQRYWPVVFLIAESEVLVILRFVSLLCDGRQGPHHGRLREEAAEVEVVRGRGRAAAVDRGGPQVRAVRLEDALVDVVVCAGVDGADGGVEGVAGQALAAVAVGGELCAVPGDEGGRGVEVGVGGQRELGLGDYEVVLRKGTK